ncbi:hypothetical protein RHS01_03646 [Rhizoctonia solani]|uniref:Uncharacterized protein n=2 Tax=Rhizoctonia solani TaxID=456999 RepID=A0A8H7IF77_9AGAM|nr:hypothetical protein RHS01_03646 [Rhizoctonia solani]
MSIGAFGLSTSPLVCLALLHTGVQGILVTLLLDFFASNNNRPIWFKTYVISVNALAAGQTAMHIVQAFESIESIAPRTEMLENIPTAIVADHSSDTTVGDNVDICDHYACSPNRSPRTTSPEVNVANGVWSFSSLAFDLITTLTNLALNEGAIVVVWQGSMAPPLILIILTIVYGYVIPDSSQVETVIVDAMMGKAFVLSLMVSIVGQGHIRQQFEQRWTPPPLTRQIPSRAGITQTDWPSVHVTIHTEPIELGAVAELASNDTQCKLVRVDFGTGSLDKAGPRSNKQDPTIPPTTYSSLAIRARDAPS